MSKELVKMFEDLKQELKQEFRELRESFERDLRKEIRDIKNSMTFINKHYEEMSASVKSMEKENAELKKNIANLQRECRELSVKSKDHETRLMQNEQYSRSFNLELKDVPQFEGEDVKEITRKLAQAVKVPLEDADIEACHRVRTAGNASAPNIIVRFVRRSKRDAFLEKAKKQKLTSAVFNLEPPVPIYVNEHLSPSVKRLLGAAKAKRRACGWKHAWTKNGKIFLRKTDNSDYVAINCLDDLSAVM